MKVSTGTLRTSRFLFDKQKTEVGQKLCFGPYTVFQISSSQIPPASTKWKDFHLSSLVLAFLHKVRRYRCCHWRLCDHAHATRCPGYRFPPPPQARTGSFLCGVGLRNTQVTRDGHPECLPNQTSPGVPAWVAQVRQVPGALAGWLSQLCLRLSLFSLRFVCLIWIWSQFWLGYYDLKWNCLPKMTSLPMLKWKTLLKV